MTRQAGEHGAIGETSAMRRAARDRLRLLAWAALALAGCQALRPAEPPPAALPSEPNAAVVQLLPPVPLAPGKVVPVGLDTVFRLAQDQNSQVQLAQLRLEEALAG